MAQRYLYDKFYNSHNVKEVSNKLETVFIDIVSRFTYRCNAVPTKILKRFLREFSKMIFKLKDLDYQI